jgi:hypothetical protein
LRALADWNYPPKLSLFYVDGGPEAVMAVREIMVGEGGGSDRARLLGLIILGSSDGLIQDDGPLVQRVVDSLGSEYPVEERLAALRVVSRAQAHGLDLHLSARASQQLRQALADVLALAQKDRAGFEKVAMELLRQDLYRQSKWMRSFGDFALRVAAGGGTIALRLHAAYAAVRGICCSLKRECIEGGFWHQGGLTGATRVLLDACALPGVRVSMRIIQGDFSELLLGLVTTEASVLDALRREGMLSECLALCLDVLPISGLQSLMLQNPLLDDSFPHVLKWVDSAAQRGQSSLQSQ